MKSNPEVQLRSKDVRNWTRFASLIWEMFPVEMGHQFHLFYAVDTIIPSHLKCMRRFRSARDAHWKFRNEVIKGTQGDRLRGYMADSFDICGHNVTDPVWPWRFILDVLLEGARRTGISDDWRLRFDAVCPEWIQQKLVEEHRQKQHAQMQQPASLGSLLAPEIDPADAWKQDAEPPRPGLNLLDRLNWNDPSKN